MTANKQHIIIKGTKDGLIFLLNDQCDYEELLQELAHKLDNTHQQILSGPIIHVQVKLGKRNVTEEQKDELASILSRHGNLIIQSIESEASKTDDPNNRLTVMKGIVRSGQTLAIEGDLLYIGDINPGGTIQATGNIYVLGAIKGMAHAGFSGNEQSVIGASLLKPTQLRIASVISRPPDEWELSGDSYMEFAYLKDQQMEIDKLVHIQQIRPEAKLFKGE